MQHPVCCVQSRLRSGIPQRLESGYLPEKFKPRSHERGFFCLSPHLVATRSLREKVEEEAQLVGDEKAPDGLSAKTAAALAMPLGYFCVHSTQIPSSLRHASQCARRHSRQSWIRTRSSFSLGMPHATQANSPAIWIPPLRADGLVHRAHPGERPHALLLDRLATPLLPSPGNSRHGQG